MGKTKILYVLEATSGGTRRHLHDLVTHLDPEQFDISLAVSNLRDPAFNHDIDDYLEKKVHVHIVPMTRSISPVKDWLAYHELKALISNNHFDIVHTHSSKAGILGRYAARDRVKSIVHTPHVFPFQMAASFLKRSLYFRLERGAAAYTTRLVAVCEAEKRLAIDSGLFPEERVSVIHNGIEPASWNPRQDGSNLRQQLNIGSRKFVVGLIGRFMPQKGHRYFLDVARTVLKQAEEMHILFVGSGPGLPAIIQAVKHQRLESAITILEQRENIADCYALCDLVVVPSHWEAFPYTVLEAMAMATPVLACAVGGIPEIIDDGVNGFLVPPDDREQFCDRLLEVYRDRQGLTKLAEAAHNKIVRNFQLEKMVKAHENLYSNLK